MASGLLLRQRGAGEQRQRRARSRRRSVLCVIILDLSLVVFLCAAVRRFGGRLHAYCFSRTARQSPDRTAPGAARRGRSWLPRCPRAGSGTPAAGPASSHSTRSTGVFLRSAQFCAAAASAPRPAAVLTVIIDDVDPASRPSGSSAAGRRPADRARTRTAPGTPAACISRPASWSCRDRRR